MTVSHPLLLIPTFLQCLYMPSIIRASGRTNNIAFCFRKVGTYQFGKKNVNFQHICPGIKTRTILAMSAMALAAMAGPETVLLNSREDGGLVVMVALRLTSLEGRWEDGLAVVKHLT